GTARRRAGWCATRVVSSSGVHRGRPALGVGGTPTEQVLAVTVGLFFRVVMRRVRVRTVGSLRRLCGWDGKTPPVLGPGVAAKRDGRPREAVGARGSGWWPVFWGRAH